MMRDGGLVAIGWPALGDLGWARLDTGSRERLRDLLQEHYENTPQANGRKASEILHFVTKIAAGDVVVAMDGQTVLGVGRVIDDEYRFDPATDFPHHRAVEWVSFEEWKLPKTSALLRTTVREIVCDAATGDYDNLLAIEEHLLTPPKIVVAPVSLPRPSALTGVAGRIQAVLERKGQVIVYGPPGTGKTYWAKRASNELAAMTAFGRRFEDLSGPEKTEVTGGDDPSIGLVRTCCFHPSYGYEDFMEGYRPQAGDSGLVYVLQDGIFKKLCQDAARKPGRRFYLVVDEINRGDIPRIFGELLTVLEKDKRGQPIILPCSGRFAVPPNVHLVGTMNTADRSIALLDAALRRRFGFVELMPDYDLFKDAAVEGLSLGAFLSWINQKIREHVGRDARNLQIGHAYFLEKEKPLSDARSFARVLRDDVIPLLEEYCYEDFAILEKILGKDIVDSETQSILPDLFADGRHADLIKAFLDNADLAVSPQQIATAAAPEEPETEKDEDEST